METSETTVVSQRGQSTQGHGPLGSLFLRLMKGIRHGSLRIEFPTGSYAVVGDHSLPMANLQILKPEFFKRVLRGGSVGFGEAYVDGLWTSPHLSELLYLLARNQGEVGRLQQGFSVAASIVNRLYHSARRNTIEQSRKNIQAHYDLSNDFYKTFLDASMTYSSACFLDERDTLEQAQYNKIDRMLALAGVAEGDSVLEIGSGWGALATRAAQQGCRVKTITLSDEQFAYAQQSFIDSGVDQKVEICLQDYRALEGKFDAVLSCEMIEAVGKEYLPSYFAKIRDSLKPGGKAVIQAITISDERYAQYSRRCDWIQKHIFPGGHLPSAAVIREQVQAAGGMCVESMTGFGRDYVETLRRWATAFNHQKPALEAMGFDAAFQRKWNYYLSYCEAGFDAELIDVQHVLISRIAD